MAIPEELDYSGGRDRATSESVDAAQLELPQYDPEEALTNPKERGIIRSAKASFGFIRSLERDERLFYHVSEYMCTGNPPVPGDSVEFVVVKNNVTSKYNAVRIYKLDKGSVTFDVSKVGATL